MSQGSARAETHTLVDNLVKKLKYKCHPLKENGDIVASDMCILCGKPIKGSPVTERINGKEYAFDKEKCALTLKKLKSVYGSDFCVNFNTPAT